MLCAILLHNSNGGFMSHYVLLEAVTVRLDSCDVMLLESSPCFRIINHKYYVIYGHTLIYISY
jgi:hypothetical protein